MSDVYGSYVAICGGMGGAKLALGLSRVVEGPALTMVVNTGDDFEHLGLHISPDVDTVLYTLAGLANPETGWGRAGETWSFMETLAALGGPTWFKLGDADLALHVERTRRLGAGATLSETTERFARTFGIDAAVVPASDDPVRTMVETDAGTLAFQDYFVARRCDPAVRAIHIEGADNAVPAPGVLEALARPDLAGVIICPSNPYLSIDPMLAVPGLRQALQDCLAPVVAVSPIIAGQAVKGPAAKIMTELGHEASTAAVAGHYGDLLDGFVLDEADAAACAEIGVPVLVTNTLMTSLEDRIALATETVGFCSRLAAEAGTQSDRVPEAAQ